MKTIFFILSFFCFSLSLQASIEHDFIVSPNMLRVGELGQFSIGLSFPDTYKLITAPTQDDFSKSTAIDYVDEKIIKNQRDATRLVSLHYLFMALELGEQLIPTQTIVLNDTDTEKYHKIVIPPQPITITSNFKAGEEKSIAIKSTIYAEKLNWKKYVFGLLIALILTGILLFLAYRYLAHRQQQQPSLPQVPVDPRSAFDIARDDIDALYEKNLYDKNLTKDHYIALSDIIKSFLGRLYHQHMVEMTSEEIYVICKNKLNQNLFLKLKNLLSFGDFIKFAKQVPSIEEHADQKEKALQFIRQTWEIEQKPADDDLEVPTL